MRSLAISALLFLLSGTAHAYPDEVYELGLQALFASWETDHPGYGPLPISAVSNSYMTFSGDATFENNETGTCCYLDLGNDGSFSVAFSQPVKSAGFLLYYVEPHHADTISMGDTTVSAIYRNSEGEVIGQDSITAGWLPPGSGGNVGWTWDNVFNGRDSTFGASHDAGFSEITFSVNGGQTQYADNSALPIHIATGYLFYQPLQPVPEPATYALMAGGLALVGCVGRRRRIAAAKTV